MLKHVKEYHKKAYNKIVNELLSNPKRMIDTQEKFEIAFGKDQKTRTGKQWRNLVRVYGVATVMQKENMSDAQIQFYCNETFSQKFHRLTKVK